ARWPVVLTMRSRPLHEIRSPRLFMKSASDDDLQYFSRSPIHCSSMLSIWLSIGIILVQERRYMYIVRRCNEISSTSNCAHSPSLSPPSRKQRTTALGLRGNSSRRCSSNCCSSGERVCLNTGVSASSSGLSKVVSKDAKNFCNAVQVALSVAGESELL